MIAGKPQPMHKPHDPETSNRDDKPKKHALEPTIKHCMFIHHDDVQTSKILILRTDETMIEISADDAYFQPKPKWTELTCGDCGYCVNLEFKIYWSDLSVNSRHCYIDPMHPACPDIQVR
jgi:hypothetical protein